MSEETPTPTTAGYISAETRKIIPTLVVTILTAFAVSYWNGQMAQNNTINRLTVVEAKVETASKSLSDNAIILNQTAVQLALLGQNQTNMFEQIKEIKQEQERIRNSIGRR